MEEGTRARDGQASLRSHVARKSGRRVDSWNMLVREFGRGSSHVHMRSRNGGSQSYAFISVAYVCCM